MKRPALPIDDIPRRCHGLFELRERLCEQRLPAANGFYLNLPPAVRLLYSPKLMIEIHRFSLLHLLVPALLALHS